MNDWCKTHHGASGLTQAPLPFHFFLLLHLMAQIEPLLERVGFLQACRESKISLAEAEERMLRFVEAHTQPGAAILAGNTVHADKGFLEVYMPRFMGHLHYRIMVRHHPRSLSHVVPCAVCRVPGR